jgi:hypothetical protein
MVDQLEHTRRLLDRIGAEVPLSGRMWTPGLTDPAVWTPGFDRGTGPAPIDYLELYLSLDQYADLKGPAEEARTPESVIAEIVGAYDRRELLGQLAHLRRLCDRPEAWPSLTAYYRGVLGRFGPALDRAMDRPGRKVRVVARQPVLAAMRELLREPLVDGVDSEQPTLATALLLTHAAGSTLETASKNTGEMIGRYPAHLLLNLARNATFYESEDVGPQIVRAWRLWREYEPSETKVKELGAKPKELLKEATGLDFEDLIAIGFGMWAHAAARQPGDPVLAGLDYFEPTAIAPEKVEAFLRVVSSTPDELRRKLEGHTGPYDFLPLQSKPVLRTDDGLLVMDAGFLLDRFTKGLYWIVHDYLKFDLGEEYRRERWNEAHSQMVEKMVRDQLRAMAPGLTGSSDRAFYDEDDLRRAYVRKDGDKVCDAAIDYGNRFLLFEIVDRQLTVPTRIEGKVSSFKTDTKRSVIDKCGQLDRTSKELVKDPSKLTNSPPVPGMRIVPVLVVAGGYPTDPVSRSYAEELVYEKGLLKGQSIEKLAIVNLPEVEMLEALAKTRHDLADILTDWKSSGLRNSSLWNYLIRRFEGKQAMLRPKRMEAQIGELFDELEGRLGLPPGTRYVPGDDRTSGLAPKR